MISRLDNLSGPNAGGNSTVTLESYKYLGLSTIVERDDPEVSGTLSLTYIGAGGGDAGDRYNGLDRFGRVVDQKWVTNGTSVQDEYTYTYDQDSNVLSKSNALVTAGTFNENYTYDSLNRLTAVSRGTQSSYQSLTLNAVGDITSVTTAGSTSNRTTNADNQITQIGSSTLSYDSNGNLIKDDQGHTLVYDAWNRLTAVYNGSTLLASYTYDGAGRRITVTESSTTTDFYFSGQQDIEERQSGNVTSQTVFSPTYVNAPILRDSGGTRLYFTADANANITGVFSVSGAADQYMVYDSGGNVAFKTSAWASGTNTQNVTELYQGMQYDKVIGWYFTPNRLYSPTMEVWNRPDPLGYIDTNSLYAFVADNPINRVDPTGLFVELSPIIVTTTEKGWDFGGPLGAAGGLAFGLGLWVGIITAPVDPAPKPKPEPRIVPLPYDPRTDPKDKDRSPCRFVMRIQIQENQGEASGLNDTMSLPLVSVNTPVTKLMVERGMLQMYIQIQTNHLDFSNAHFPKKYLQDLSGAIAHMSQWIQRISPNGLPGTGNFHTENFPDVEEEYRLDLESNSNPGGKTGPWNLAG